MYKHERKKARNSPQQGLILQRVGIVESFFCQTGFPFKRKEKSKKEQNRHPRRKEKHETANAVLMLQVRTLEASNVKKKNTKSATVPPPGGAVFPKDFCSPALCCSGVEMKKGVRCIRGGVKEGIKSLRTCGMREWVGSSSRAPGVSGVSCASVVGTCAAC
jgi:hypothetical protein